MRRATVLLATAFLLLATAGTALADPPAEHPGQGKGLEKKAENAPDTPNRPDKVDICHRSDDGSFHVISINENALDAHLAHGDAMGVTFDDENRKGNNGRLDCTSLALFDEPFELSPETVFANGGVYDNEWVENAIAEDYTGEVNVGLSLDGTEVVFVFEFANLPVNEIFTVYLDSDGGSPGPFTVLGTFLVDSFGEGTFEYSAAPGPGTYTWSFWVNQPTPPASVLQTGDITFTIE